MHSAPNLISGCQGESILGCPGQPKNTEYSYEFVDINFRAA